MTRVDELCSECSVKPAGPGGSGLCDDCWIELVQPGCEDCGVELISDECSPADPCGLCPACAGSEAHTARAASELARLAGCSQEELLVALYDLQQVGLAERVGGRREDSYWKAAA